MVKVLPDPVTPSRTWWRSPRRRPSLSWAMARGWSPRGWYSQTSLNRNGPGSGEGRAWKAGSSGGACGSARARVGSALRRTCGLVFTSLPRFRRGGRCRRGSLWLSFDPCCGRRAAPAGPQPCVRAAKSGYGWSGTAASGTTRTVPNARTLGSRTLCLLAFQMRSHSRASP